MKNFLLLILILFANFLFADSNISFQISVNPNDTIIDGKHYTIKNLQGTVIETYTVKKGEKHGLRKCYNNQGDLILEERYKNGFLHGKRKEYYPDGRLKLSERYKYFPKERKSVVHGLHKKYQSDNSYSVYRLKNGEHTGKFTTYHPNGRLKEKGRYKDNLMVGKYEVYEMNGNIAKVEHYAILDPEKGKKSRNSEANKEMITQPWKKNVLNGVCKYYILGQLTGLRTYKMGVKDGVFEDYYFYSPYSSLLSREEYKDGKKHGRFEFYDQNGKLEKKGIFYQQIEVNGKKFTDIYDGEILYYHSTGVLSSVEHWKDYKKNGYFRHYYPNGELSYEATFQDNLKVGIETRWTEKGQKYFEAFYEIIEKDGEFISVKDGLERTWRDGQLYTEMNYVNGLRNGTYKVYYPDGILKEEKEFVNDSLNGKYFTYYSDGKIERKSYYQSSIYGNNFIGWSKLYEEGTDHLEKAIYSNGKGKNVIIKEYQDIQPIRFRVTDVFLLDYHPNGTISRLSFSPLNQIEFYFFSNGQLRKLSYYDSEGSPLKVSFSAIGKVIQVSNNNTIYSHDSIKHQSEIYAQLIPLNWSDNTFIKDSLKNGKYRLNYADGSPFLEIEFKNDLPHGDWVSYDAISKDTLFFIQFQEGKTAGEWLQKRNNGLPLTKRVFNENEFLVERTQYYDNGNKNNLTRFDEKSKKYYYVETYFLNGQLKSRSNDLTGLSYTYKENGDLLYSREYLLDTDSIQISKSYYPDQNQIKDSTAINIKQKLGVHVTYFSNGQISASSQIDIRKQKVGDFKTYFENGQLRTYGRYTEGKKDGTWLTYNEKGELVKTEVYQEGILQINKEEEEECACYDYTLSVTKAGFAQPVSVFTSYKGVLRTLPSYVYPIDSLNFNSIYFINYRGDYQFSTMTLLPFREFAFYLGHKKGLKIDLLPCPTKEFRNNLQLSVGKVKNQVSSALVEFKRMAIQFENNPLTDTLGRPFRAYFDGNYLELRDKMLQLQFKDQLNACFPKSKLSNFLTFEKLSGHPYLSLLSASDGYHLPLGNIPVTDSESKRFNGVVLTDGDVNFTIERIVIIMDEDTGETVSQEDFSVHFKGEVESMMVGENWVVGSLFIDGTLSKDGSFFRYNKNEISLEEMERYFKSKGFMRLNFYYMEDKSRLRIHFYSER